MNKAEEELFQQYKEYYEKTRMDPSKQSSLFNDPYLLNMKKRLPPELRETYEQIGKEMYSFDFETDGVQFEQRKKAMKIVQTLRMGLDPSDLKPEEVQLLESVLGKDWKDTYETFTF
jgi:hypothetical protein